MTRKSSVRRLNRLLCTLAILTSLAAGCGTTEPEGPLLGRTYRYVAQSRADPGYRWTGTLTFAEDSSSPLGRVPRRAELERTGGSDHLPHRVSSSIVLWSFDEHPEEVRLVFPVVITQQYEMMHEGRIVRGRIEGEWMAPGGSGTFTATVR